MKSLVSILALVALTPSADSGWAEKFAFWIHGELHRQTHRIAEIDRERSTLVELTLINSCTRVGLKSDYETDAEEL
jgi:hypothetical protein